MKTFNPKSIAAPNGTYSHGALLPRGAQILYVAGQVAIKPEGSIPDTLEEQAEVVWKNLLAGGGLLEVRRDPRPVPGKPPPGLDPRGRVRPRQPEVSGRGGGRGVSWQMKALFFNEGG